MTREEKVARLFMYRELAASKAKETGTIPDWLIYQIVSLREELKRSEHESNDE